MNTPLVLSLDDAASLDSVGGKALNLARLHQAGFPVPPAFVLTTSAYRRFVQANALSATITAQMRALDGAGPVGLDAASRAIRERFAAGQMPGEIAAALDAGYAGLGRPPVAVRSSATAEDLPGLSFAGQHDTFLHVVGEEALRRAVIDCWSSLWTARAIAYRVRNSLDQSAITLAVVVQEMAPSQSSGVLFTANPLTGKRDETVIDATYGLGEALVSGQVEPDQYVVGSKAADGGDAAGWWILSKTLGSKALAIHGRPGGGTTVLQEDAAGRQVLPDVMILELARLGRRVAERLGAPQDVEWAAVGEKLYLLQARPITTLYPLPVGMPTEPLRAMISFGSVQGMLDPMTPLGRDAIGTTLIGAGKVFGARVTLETQTLLWEAGERLWIDVSGLARTRVGRRLALAALPYVDPSAGQAFHTLIEQGRFPPPGPLRARTAWRVLRALFPMLVRAIRTLLRPDAERDRLFRLLEGMLADSERRFEQAASLSERLSLIRRMADRAFDFVIPHFVPRFGMGMATYNLLSRLAATLPTGVEDAGIDVRVMMRGAPHNVTTEMDLALWETAQTIRADPESLAYFSAHEAAALAVDDQQGRLPPVAQAAIGLFMQRYGMRGLAEIDLGRPRWREEPLPILQTLRSYLEITDAHQAPDAVFERGAQTAEVEIDRLVTALHGTRGGWLKARLARWAARRMRALVGLREAPKFAVVRIMGLMRRVLLADGARLAAEGLLARPDDVFMLHLRELDALAAGDARDWAALAEARRQRRAQELKRRQVPRLLLSDGHVYYGGESASDSHEAEDLSGTPVSPGTVEGVVRVVLDPRRTQLQPGEILVCPGTDPSWTPLFLTAGGLVMEVGGMMTHGAVVAREYGLPAVVGVHQATLRLRSGQRIRVDGSTGRVVLLDDGSPGS